LHATKKSITVLLMEPSLRSLMVWLSWATGTLGVGQNTYIVGGAPRNFLLGLQIKDLDLVIEVSSNRDSQWLARRLTSLIPAATKTVTNQYGVAILTVVGPWTLEGFPMMGITLEIANARRESYGKGGKGYKPDSVELASIQEDLLRRDFTVNTFMWRLSDLAGGPESVSVLGSEQAMQDLRNKILRTPCDPDTTFSDDPTRMLRAVRFEQRLGLRIAPETEEAIRRCAHKLKDMPWDAVRKILVEDILSGTNPRESFRSLGRLGLASVLLEMLLSDRGFFAAVSRGLRGFDPELLLDLWEAGWHLSCSPGGLVPHDSLNRLRGSLRTHGRGFLKAMESPQINQPALFERFALFGAARSRVLKVARECLLGDPRLHSDPVALEEAVAKVLSQQP